MRGGVTMDCKCHPICPQAGARRVEGTDPGKESKKRAPADHRIM